MFNSLVTYQGKGKSHIKYLSKMADRIWMENKYTIDWNICLFDAFKQHREYLISLERYQRPMKFNMPKSSGIWLPKGDGTWVEKPFGDPIDI